MTPAEPGEPAAEAPSAPAGTRPAWWDWMGRHRKPVLLVSGLLVVAAVATLVSVALLTATPGDVVRRYLDAIQAGDTGTALRIAGGEPADAGALDFLTADALADDWSVDAVVERHRREDSADVDVTISADDHSAQGRFHVVEGQDGWTIESPFVRVELTAGPLDTVELGEVRLRGAGTGRTTRLLLFPGVYDLYPSLSGQAVFDPAVLVAAPQETTGETLRVTTVPTLTGSGAAAVQRAVEARVDDCATVRVVSPPGCPFSAAAIGNLTDLGDITWTVVTHPEARVVTGRDGGLQLVTRRPGTVRVTGSGVPYDPEDGPRTTFTRNCEFRLDGLAVTMTMAGFTVGPGGRADSAARLFTRCH